MTSKSKAKGTAAETAVVKYLRDTWSLPLVERRALSGSGDRGDIAGIPGVVIEVKDAEDKRLPKWKEETLAEMANDNAEICALVVKRARKNVSLWDCYVPFRLLHCHESVGHPSTHLDFWVRMEFCDFVSYLMGEGYIS